MNGRDGDDTLVGSKGCDLFSLSDWSTGYTYNWRGEQIVDFKSGEHKILIRCARQAVRRMRRSAASGRRAHFCRDNGRAGRWPLSEVPAAS